MIYLLLRPGFVFIKAIVRWWGHLGRRTVPSLPGLRRLDYYSDEISNDSLNLDNWCNVQVAVRSWLIYGLLCSINTCDMWALKRYWRLDLSLAERNGVLIKSCFLFKEQCN